MKRIKTVGKWMAVKIKNIFFNHIFYYTNIGNETSEQIPFINTYFYICNKI